MRFTDSQGRTLLIRAVVQPGDVENDPGIAVQGIAMITDGTSNTVLFAERTGSTASCSADPDTGAQGLDSMSLLFRDPRSGELIEFLIQPVDTPASIPGTFEVVVRAGDDVWSGDITIKQPGPPARINDRR